MKMMKKISGILALVCLLLSVSLLVCACDSDKDNETATTAATEQPTNAPTEAPTTGKEEQPTQPSDGKVTYTVQIMDPDGKGVEGVLVQMCDDSGCKLPQATDANGEVIFKFKESNYHVTLSNLPAGLVAEAEYHFTTDTLRIVLKKA
ncbi:MAG: hypothetical protein IJX19_12910 [Clostridia bacterium]|nr:hypothetical protein [Clostridia bacterium]